MGEVVVRVNYSPCYVAVVQSTRGKKRIVYKHNDVTEGDKKITKNLISDNNLLKANSECRSMGSPLCSTAADAGVALPDVSRYVDLVPANIPDICELNCGSLTAASAVQHSPSEVVNTSNALSRASSHQVIGSALSFFRWGLPQKSNAAFITPFRVMYRGYCSHRFECP
jgi:hypothetical protein